jgi:membrane dipeptidase
MRRGWTDAQIAQLAGENVLRVLAAAESVAVKLRDQPPSAATLGGGPTAVD